MFLFSIIHKNYRKKKHQRNSLTAFVSLINKYVKKNYVNLKWMKLKGTVWHLKQSRLLHFMKKHSHGQASPFILVHFKSSEKKHFLLLFFLLKQTFYCSKYIVCNEALTKYIPLHTSRTNINTLYRVFFKINRSIHFIRKTNHQLFLWCKIHSLFKTIMKSEKIERWIDK